MNNHCSYKTIGNGLCVELFDKNNVSIDFLQGDDAAYFLREAQAIEAGKGWHVTVFENADNALDAMIMQYAQDGLIA